MMQVDITQICPKFILADKNGFALAKAMETGLNLFCNTLETGKKNVFDIATMPEWRLDEMAWELKCLYDYNADVETKRYWIQNATNFAIQYGTPNAVSEFLGVYFDAVEIQEWWEYNGSPYHYRIVMDGEFDAEKMAWARDNVARVQNLRSKLDNIWIGVTANVNVQVETEWFPADVAYSSADTMTGIIPDNNFLFMP